MPVTESFWDYLMRITDGATGVTISRAAEVDAGNVSRWKTGKTRPSAETVVKIARTWHRPPVEALVASGHLSADEVGGDVVEVAMSAGDLAVDDLIEEMRRRIATAEAQSAFIDALTQGAAIWIGEAPHSPGVSVTREGDQVTANLVLSPSNELRIHSTLAAQTQGEPDDLAAQPTTTSSEGEAPEGEKTGAGDPRSKLTALPTEFQGEDPDLPPIEQLAAESGGTKGIETQPGDEDFSQDTDDHDDE